LYFRKATLIIAAIIFLLLVGGGVYVYMKPMDGVLILEYHKVSNDDDVYSVPEREMAAQLDYLKAEGYTTISMRDFARARKGRVELPEKPIVLTFDDGYKNNYTKLYPLLLARDMKATIYVAVNRLGLDEYMTWENLREMEAHGIEIGSHTANHLPLTELSKDKQFEELRASKLLIEWNGLKTVYAFSYPNGKYDGGIIQMLKEDGYLTAVTGDAGYNTFKTDPYRLHRLNIPKPRFGLLEFKLRIFKAKLLTTLNIYQH